MTNEAAEVLSLFWRSVITIITLKTFDYLRNYMILRKSRHLDAFSRALSLVNLRR